MSSGKILEKADIAKLTPEEKIQLAKAMSVPIRCGGCWSENGQLYYIFMGNKLTEEQFKALRGTQEHLEAKIQEYKDAGIITKRKYGDITMAVRRIKRGASLSSMVKLYDFSDDEIIQIQNILAKMDK